jgi:hypothetical protein
MNDEELLNYVEAKVIENMLDGCEIDDLLGYKKYDVGAWSVSFRADTLSRLIDMARKYKRTWVGLTDEEIAQGCKESWVTEQAWQSAVWWAEEKLKEKNT